MSVHYRADVPLGLFDPLHLGQVWNGCASIQRVPVLDLTQQEVWVSLQEEEEQASVTDTPQRDKHSTAGHRVKHTS